MADPLAPGQVQLFDNDIPPFPAGTYDIVAKQDLSVATDGYFGSPAKQRFEVRAPEFALDPGEVAATFPPANAAGDFSHVLPHVVLTEPTLPWERLVDGQPASTPWLALVVLTAVEVVSITATTAGDFLTSDPDVVRPSVDRTTLSPAALAAPMTELVLPAAVFQAVLPLATELPYLAHVRNANLSGQELQGAAEDGWFSVVVASRFPDSAAGPGTGGTRNDVHLVSLEGLGPLLVADPDFGQKPSGGPRDVALASLYSWSFVSAEAAGGTFAELMGGLVTAAAGDPANLLPRIPYALPDDPTAAESTVAARFAAGYAALGFVAPSGEETFAWYRGPWTPVVAPPLPPKPSHRYTSADQATVYVESDGVFDLSYAAAWTLGRTMALADRSFATALYGFRRAVHQLVDLLVDRVRAVGGATGDLAALAASNALVQRFGSLLTEGMVASLTTVVGGIDATTGTNAPAVAPAEPPAPAPATSAVPGLLALPGATDLVGGAVADDLAPVAAWLARLTLLDGVPFPHLVPDPSMLPVESIRFCYVDQGWVGALVDGALSVAIESSRDVYVHEVFDGAIDAAVATAAGGTAAAGMLLRSAVVAGWPGLTVTAEANGAVVPTVRMERLSADVLLCLFAAVPDTVHLDEPAQGLRFGMEDGNVLGLRSLSSSPPVGTPLGTRFPATGDLTAFFRPLVSGAGGNVLSMSDLVPALAAATGTSTLGAADVAVQLVLAPERLTFAPLKGGARD